MVASGTALFMALTAFCLLSCSPISRQIRQEAETDVEFSILREEVDEYRGETVILGGYILEIENMADEATIVVLQTPLKFRHRPKFKDHSKGRFIATHSEMLDPAVYTPGRRITLAGKVVGTTSEMVEICPMPCLTVAVSELHLWAEYHYPRHYYGHGYYYHGRFGFGLHHRRYW